MIKPNWDIFKSKFIGRDQQDQFEWFCYLLFCKEFNKPLGIFRYKSQAGIETVPISEGNEIIGFQAKFYNSTLSDHKAVLIKSLEDAKNRHPNITKIIFYTNEEWGQGKDENDPKAKIEIEAKAKDLDIKLGNEDWRCASYFESEFVCIQNEIIAKHFFSLEKSIFNVIDLLNEHSENRLIRPQINFNDNSIEISIDAHLSNIKNTKDKVLILRGVGGVGKTAIISRFYEQLKTEKDTACYIFKANEFELGNISNLVDGFVLSDFIDAHKELAKKIIVIDSAEKLLDIKNTDTFKTFLSKLLKENWQFIFTTRDNYVENLNTDFFEFYNINPTNIGVENLSLAELQQLAEKNSFVLPADEKVLELIRNPFYLNQYLKFYKPTEKLTIVEFKSKLWNQVIRHNKPAREQCFLQIALKRANEGQFFIQPDFDANILEELKKDEILGYETAGYFITHDIYEEWALEKVIGMAFINKSNDHSFFETIGESLPIRRSFRRWLSEKLLLEQANIKIFIENVVDDKTIASFWQDELLVSVLLSDYSSNFFEFFKEELLDNDLSLLIKISFLLRLACKEVDANALKNLAIDNINLFSLKVVLTQPRGQGWNSFIKYVFENLENVGYKNITFILPIIHDWNSKFKQGETTRLSSLIALKYYQWVIQERVYLSRDESKKQLLETIVYGCVEIKAELKEVFSEIVKNKWKQHRDPYSDLSKMILTKLEGITVALTLPQSVLQLANLFWTTTPKQNEYNYSHGTERYFGLEKNHGNYSPASAYQTPIYWLLQSSLQETIDFILAFTNRAVEFYSKHSKQVEEVTLFISDKVTVTQYHSHSLWCIYRGNSSPVTPYLLQSIHMALEKFLLERFKDAETKIVESWLIYLLKNSKSSSITAVITSIVLAYPDKTFNIAAILFKTREFFEADLSRKLSESEARSLYSIGYGLNYNDKLFEDERIKTCDDKHRKLCLEDLFLQYQFFRNEGVSEEEAVNRQTILWQILDNYYNQLANNKELEKTWRLCLARMDKRKIAVTTKTTEKGIEIHFQPELEPELKEYSEQTAEIYSEAMKYMSLNVWLSFRREYNQKYKDSNCQQYESNPSFAVQQVKEIFSDNNQLENLFNLGVPASVCAVLMRDFFDKISIEDSIFCKDILLQYATLFLQKNYQYQVGDGIEPAFSVLSILLQKFPDEKNEIKQILLLSLFNEYLVNQLNNFNTSPVNEVEKLWESHFEDAQSLLFGYLLLKPKYNTLIRIIQKEKYDLNTYIERLYQENELDLQKFINNQLSLTDIGVIDEIDLSILKTAFQLIPNKTTNSEHQHLIKNIISIFSKKLFLKKYNDKIDYDVRHGFTRKLSEFILSCKFNEIQEYLNPILENFNDSEELANLLKEIISAQDYVSSYENFWEIWLLFKPKIIELCKMNNNWQTDKVLKSYLFSQNMWKETAVDWHTFKEKGKKFFKDITTQIGYHPSVLYAIAKLLNGVGSNYLNDGITWLSTMLTNNENLHKEKLENNTIYYLESISRKHIYKKREDIKKTKQLKQEVLVILNFLVENGSVVGYMLRENIL